MWDLFHPIEDEVRKRKCRAGISSSAPILGSIVRSKHESHQTILTFLDWRFDDALTELVINDGGILSDDGYIQRRRRFRIP
jgi:hypothetical protein